MQCSQNAFDLFTPAPAKLKNTLAISKTTLKPLEGVYTLVAGDNGLGEEFVCKVSRNKVSLFSNYRGIFCIMEAGLGQDSSIQLYGFWRVSENTTSGAVYFTIPKNQGAQQFLKLNSTTELKIAGSYSYGEAKRDLVLQYTRDFLPAAKANPLVIFGHHGIQTNASPPFQENSLEAFRQAEDYGAIGLEVDIRLTKDNVPVLYHDTDINIRLTKKSGIYSDLDKLTYAVHQQGARS